MIILSYGAEVWGFTQANAIEILHLKFCKSLLGVKTWTQNDCVYGELGRKSLITYRYLKILKYWLKIITIQYNAIQNKCIVATFKQYKINSTKVRQTTQC